MIAAKARIDSKEISGVVIGLIVIVESFCHQIILPIRYFRSFRGHSLHYSKFLILTIRYSSIAISSVYSAYSVVKIPSLKLPSSVFCPRSASSC